MIHGSRLLRVSTAASLLAVAVTAMPSFAQAPGGSAPGGGAPGGAAPGGAPAGAPGGGRGGGFGGGRAAAPRPAFIPEGYDDHQNMMDQLGIKALRPGKNGQNQTGPGFEEASA